MTTANKELEGLGKRRDGLVEEAARLREEGDKLRLQSQPTSEISQRLQQIDSEMPGLNQNYKEARRANGREQARQLADDRAFQATLRAALDVLEPLVNLADAIAQQRGQGVTLDPLPRPLVELVAATRVYVAYLRRIGAIEEAK